MNTYVSLKEKLYYKHLPLLEITLDQLISLPTAIPLWYQPAQPITYIIVYCFKWRLLTIKLCRMGKISLFMSATIQQCLNMAGNRLVCVINTL